jgi:hypothetical protein
VLGGHYNNSLTLALSSHAIKFSKTLHTLSFVGVEVPGGGKSFLKLRQMYYRWTDENETVVSAVHNMNYEMRTSESDFEIHLTY